MNIGKPHKHDYLIFMIAVLIAVSVFITMRSAGDFNFVARQYPAGFRDLILNSGASRRTSTSSLLAGLETRLAEQAPEPTIDICQALFSDAADPTVGPTSAEVTIVEFFDYQCPYCRVVAEFLVEVQANDPRVRIVFKEWPILGSDSELAARAALAAAQQGQYLRFHETLMRTRGVPNEAIIRYAASKVVIDPDQILVELKSVKFDDVIRRNNQLAKQLGLIGTPSFVVGRTIVEGAITRNQMEKLIDLEAKSPAIAICQASF
jgi:protein-disulfide isomerase